MDGQTSTTNNMCNESSVKSPASPESSVLSNFSGNSKESTVDSNAQLLTLKSLGGGEPLVFVYSAHNTEFVDILK